MPKDNQKNLKQSRREKQRAQKVTHHWLGLGALAVV